MVTGLVRRGRPGDRRRLPPEWSREPPCACRRGHPVRRRDQLPAAVAARRDRAEGRPREARDRRRGRPSWGRQQPAGPPRGLHPVRVQAAGLDRPLAQAPAQATDRRRVALPAPWGGLLQPLRGGRLHPEQRRRRLPEPDVPLPPHRHPVRRFPPGRRARLPGAHRSDVLRRTRHREAEVTRPLRAPSPAVQLPLHGERPPRVDRDGPGSAPHPQPACIRGVQRRRAVAGAFRRVRPGDPRLGRRGCRDRAAPFLHRPHGGRRRLGARPRDDARPRCRRSAGRRRLLDALRDQRQHLRARDDARREGRRPDPRATPRCRPPTRRTTATATATRSTRPVDQPPTVHGQRHAQPPPARASR